MANVPSDLIQWLGYLLYLLGAVVLWVYCREQNRNEKRITDLEKTRPTHDDVTNMIKAALYEDITRP